MSQVTEPHGVFAKRFQDFVAAKCNVDTSQVSVVPSFFSTEHIPTSAETGRWIITWESGPVFYGKCRVVSELEVYWGGRGSRSYRGEVLTDPTWLDLGVEAERSMRSTKDLHHCFLESAAVIQSDLEALAGVGDTEVVRTIQLYMGS